MCKSFFPIFERCSVIQSSCIKIQVKGSSLIGTVKFFDGGVKKLGDFYVIIGTIEKCFAEIRKYFADPALKESCIENIRKEKTRLSWMNFCRRLEDFAAGL